MGRVPQLLMRDLLREAMPLLPQFKPQVGLGEGPREREGMVALCWHCNGWAHVDSPALSARQHPCRPVMPAASPLLLPCRS